MATERPWLTELLVCPGCSATLGRDDDALTCANGHRYEIVGGIPRFVPPSSYADNFGFEWTTFPRLQLDDDSSSESEESFAEKTGLTRSDVEGRSVFDAGCGMGRFSSVAAGWGAAHVVGVDISRAVEAAAENLANLDRVALAQADLRHLPFAPATFDIVFSIGVLHHTPSTFASLSSVARLVKPGGTLAVWVYSNRLRWTLAGGDIVRPVTSRLTAERLLKLVRWVTPRMHRLKGGRPRMTRALDIILPTSNHPDPDWRALDTFDWYSPRYQWKHTNAEVEGWFRLLGFEDVTRLPVPVSVRGRRRP